MSKPSRKLGRRILLASALGALCSTCAQIPKPFVPKSSTAPPIVYCNDATGHKPGAVPWVLGGTCCCTPTDELMAKLHADGICVGMDAAALRAKYEEAGIALRGPGHQWCNGSCPSGPHVVLGGKCMCPPTPGTEYYERVVAGIGAVPRAGATTQPAKPQP